MKYISIPEPGKVEILEAPTPQPRPGEALLKLLYGGICGSDLGTYTGSFLYAHYPLIPGHEFSAQIVSVPENDLGLTEGMIVTANPYFNCGECYSCRRGFVNCCTSNQTMGAQRDGAFLQYITMPLSRIYDGKGLDPQLLALIEPFCISYHAAKRACIRPGDRVLVVGAGTIGCLAVAAARLMGAQVYVSDISEFRLEKARRLGAVGCFQNTRDDAFANWVKETTGGDGFDVCMEAVGLPNTFQNCVDAAAFQGRVIVIGTGKRSLDFKYSVIQTKELNIHGSRNALKEDFLELIDAVSAGNIDVSPLITNVFDLDQAPEAFETLRTQGATMLKTLIRF